MFKIQIFKLHKVISIAFNNFVVLIGDV